MKQRWILLGLVALTVAALSTGCTSKKPKINTNLTGTDSDTIGLGSDQLIIGYDEFGNPIYADSSDPSMMRLDGEVVGAGQFQPIYFEYDARSAKSATPAPIRIPATRNNLSERFPGCRGPRCPAGVPPYVVQTVSVHHRSRLFSFFPIRRTFMN